MSGPALASLGNTRPLTRHKTLSGRVDGGGDRELGDTGRLTGYAAEEPSVAAQGRVKSAAARSLSVFELPPEWPGDFVCDIVCRGRRYRSRSDAPR